MRKKEAYNHKIFKNKNAEKVDYFVFTVLVFIIGIVPLIVKYAEVPVGSDEYSIVRLTATVEDVFSYYKSGLIVASAALLSFYYLYRFFTSDFDLNLKEWFKNPIFTAFMVYTAAVILSSLFSPFKYTVVHGISERYESAFVLLSYLIIFYAVRDFTRAPLQANLILYVLTASAFVLGLVSLSQFVNRDVFQTAFGKEYAGFPQGLLAKFILSGAHYNSLKEANGALGNLDPVFDVVYATLYNPNCVGLYGALAAPLFTVTGIFWPNRSPFKYILLSMGVFACFMILGARSSGGLLGISVAAAASLMMIIIYYVRQKKRGSSFSLPIAVGVLCVIAALAFIPTIQSNLKTMVYKFYEYTNPVNNHFLKDLRVQGSTLAIDTEIGTLTFDFQDGLDNLAISDPDGASIPFLTTETFDDAPGVSVSSYSSPVFGNVSLVREFNMFSISFSGQIMLFTLAEGNEVVPLTNMFKPVDLHEPIPAIGFSGYELFGSGRGYIWSRSLPMVLNNPLLGTGSDTFILSFPQHDIVGKTRYLGNPYIVVDKPHNYYLQVAISTGLVSLAAILFIFCLYVVTTFFSLLKEPGRDFGLRLGIWAGVCGYLVSALSTDSTVSVSPVFWAVLGLGFGVEQYAKNRTGDKL